MAPSEGGLIIKLEATLHRHALACTACVAQVPVWVMTSYTGSIDVGGVSSFLPPYFPSFQKESRIGKEQIV